MNFSISMSQTFCGKCYTKKIFIAHQKFKFNWDSCILSGSASIIYTRFHYHKESFWGKCELFQCVYMIIEQNLDGLSRSLRMRKVFFFFFFFFPFPCLFISVKSSSEQCSIMVNWQLYHVLWVPRINFLLGSCYTWAHVVFTKTKILYCILAWSLLRILA